MSNRQRFFAGHKFGGGYYYHPGVLNNGFVLSSKNDMSFLIMNFSERFFIAKGSKKTHKVRITVTAYYKDLKFDKSL